jgi:hypothetical protein
MVGKHFHSSFVSFHLIVTDFKLLSMSENIYGGYKESLLSNQDEQIIVGVLVVVIFVAMGFDAPPDITFLIGE